jgi:precorrin-3B C17-methyltransferase
MKSKLYVVGIGPGDSRYLTGEAAQALEEAELIVGYNIYVNILCEQKSYPGKEFYSTGMGDEVDRCRYAVEQAEKGRTVAVICSGDAGVYGMASLVLSLAEKHNTVNITIVPGITAALSGAALLGAPIGNDFAVISLSTALTPWERIEKRLEGAAGADLAIVLYNPMSRHRPDTLSRACAIISEHTGDDRVAGYVRNIGRSGEEHSLTTVGELKNAKLDMFTTVFIGSSDTNVINGKMITGRKYEVEQDTGICRDDRR